MRKWCDSYREDVFALDLGHMRRVDEFQFLNGALQNKKEYEASEAPGNPHGAVLRSELNQSRPIRAHSMQHDRRSAGAFLISNTPIDGSDGHTHPHWRPVGWPLTGSLCLFSAFITLRLLQPSCRFHHLNKEISQQPQHDILISFFLSLSLSLYFFLSFSLPSTLFLLLLLLLFPSPSRLPIFLFLF